MSDLTNFSSQHTANRARSCGNFPVKILSTILADYQNAHIVLLDPHNEYASAFRELAEIVNVDKLRLPFWLFDSEEPVGMLVRGGTP